MKDTWGWLPGVGVLLWATSQGFAFYDFPKCPPTGHHDYPNDNCQLYYACDNGTLKVLSCPVGELFDRIFLRCRIGFLVDCAFIPIPTIPPDNTTSNPTNSSTPSGATSTTLKPTKSTTVTTRQTTTPSSSTSPITTRPPTQTTSPTPSTLKPPVVCPPDGTKIYPTGDCVSYYNCTNGKYVQEKCPSGYLVDPNTAQCKPFYQVTCYPSTSPPATTPTTPSVCPSQGSKIVPTGDCFTYYNCTNGHYVQEKCPSGYLVDPQTAQCKPFYQVTCYPSTAAPATTASTPSVCPSQGSKIVPTGDCVTYYNCTNGQYVKSNCPSGYLMDPKTLQCKPFYQVTCYPSTDAAATTASTPSVCPSEGSKIVPTGDCFTYYNCTDGQYVQETCPSGYLVDPETAQCKPFYQVTCYPSTATPATTPTTPSVCPSEGSKIVPTGDCFTYYNCTDGQYVKETCPSGYLVDPKTAQCKPFYQVTCYPSKSAPETTPTTPKMTTSSLAICPSEGSKIVPTGDCYTYYNCTNGQYVVGRCPPGYLVDPQTGQCRIFFYVTCYPAATTTNTPATTPTTPSVCPSQGSKIVPTGDCVSYYNCTNGQYVESKCPSGYLMDPKTTQCKPFYQVTCYPSTGNPATTPTTPSVCPSEGSKIVPTGDCFTYYNCTNGQYVQDKCPSGYLVDPKTAQCEPFYQVTCYPSTTAPAT